MLYRVFPFRDGSAIDEPGGALYVPRERQGAGRHDNPELYGALYTSRSPIAAVAERLQAFRGQELTEHDLHRTDGFVDALVELDDGGLENLVDLDDPAQLLRRGLRPSQIATHDRSVTRETAARLFAEGTQGMVWWSTLEASWPHVTLFVERASQSLQVHREPVPLAIDHHTVVAAANALGVRLR